MSRRGISSVKAYFLAAACLMLASGAVWAQAAGRSGVGHAGGFQHGGMGNRHGSGFNRGSEFTPTAEGISGSLYGRGYNSSYGLGYGYGLYGRGYGANMGFSSGLSNGYGLGYSTGNGIGYQTFSNPYNYNGNRAPLNGGVYRYGGAAIQGFSTPMRRQAQVTPADNAAHLQIIVPANAELWFNGSKTSRTGAQREFVSPPLKTGKVYTYDIKARWMQDGAPVAQNRSIQVRANEWQRIDFTRPEAATTAAK